MEDLSQADGDSTFHLSDDRFQQRKRFLELLQLIKGEGITLKMHQNTTVSAHFEAADCNFEVIAVSSLNTPIGIQKTALIRTGDVVSFSTSSTS